MPGRVGGEGVTRLGFARSLYGQQFAGDVPDGIFSLRLGARPSGSPERVQGRPRFAGAHIFADEVSFRNRHIKFWWRLRRIVGRVFDHQTFLSSVGWTGAFHWFCADPNRQHLQAQIPPNAVLEMDYVIALLKVSEVNVQGRARCLRVRRFEPARSLDLVAPEDLGIRDDYNPCRVRYETTRERSQVSLGFRVEGSGVRAGKSEFFPNLVETLPLAIVVEKDVNRIILP